MKPVVYPALSTVDVMAESFRAVSGNLPTSIEMIRTVAGLALPVRCNLFVPDGFGSCSYPDICKQLMAIFDFTYDNCPQELIEWGFDCNCPFDLPIQAIE